MMYPQYMESILIFQLFGIPTTSGHFHISIVVPSSTAPSKKTKKQLRVTRVAKDDDLPDRPKI